MKLASALLTTLSLAAMTWAKVQEYPLYRLDPKTYPLHQNNDAVPIQCIKRQIDTGEHIFDKETNEIVYHAFPSCFETNKPLSLAYGQDSSLACTIQMEDELFHMFQLYLHKDVPWTCRLETRKGSGVYVPIDIALRGDVAESHIDLDPNVNVIIQSIAGDSDSSSGEIVAGTAWSSSLTTSKVIIGDLVKMTFNVHWSSQKSDSQLLALDSDDTSNKDAQDDEEQVVSRVLYFQGSENKVRSLYWAIYLLSFALLSVSGAFCYYSFFRPAQKNDYFDGFVGKVE